MSGPVVPATTDALDEAAAILRRGGLVAFPTETVYGLGADASNPAALRRLYAVKGRPASHPVIVHLASAEALGDWAAEVPVTARALAEALWPGPLTLVLRRSPRVADGATGGRDTVGLRVPDQPVARSLLERFGGGVAAPSANRFGRVSPTTAAHVATDLGADVDLVLDGGPCPVGVESTIVDCTVDPPMVLRPGGLAVERIEAVLGGPVQRVATGPSRASGMLSSHYAPRCAVVLVARSEAPAALAAARANGQSADVLDPGDDVDAYARGLYGWLRDADERQLDVLLVVPPPPTGLGLAVRDRLAKAAAPRPGAVGP